MPQVLDLLAAVQPRQRLELRALTLRPLHHHPHRSVRAEIRETTDRHPLAPGERQRLRIDAIRKTERQDAHLHEIAAMNALEALRQHRPYAEQRRSLRRPVA